MTSVEKPVKALFLGGAYAQIPVLKEAQARGYYIITCDYLPDNPGHKLADEYHNVSTTDMQGVLTLAKKVRPDFVVAYASDPAAPVAAFVSEKLGLPGNPYESVRILSEKDLFRNYLKDRGLNSPEFVLLTENNNPDEKLRLLKFPYIIKPTDSSGSKGVSKVTSPDEIDPAVKTAFSFSRSSRIIAETFIDNDLADIHGDGFVVDGELVFSYLGDHFYNWKSNPYNPIATFWPSKQPAYIIKKIEEDGAVIIKGTGFRNGPLNIEARVNSEGKHFIMEIGPRSGGNFVPQAILYATGFDMVKASLDIMEGKKILIPEQPRKCSAYYVVHSDCDGRLLHLSLSEKLKPFVKEFHQFAQPGEKIKAFHGANAAIGIIILSFSSLKEMSSVMNRINDFYSLKTV
jgi:biotin carboxylase